MQYRIFTPTTASATSNTISLATNNVISICCNSLLIGENITLQVYDSANNVWANAVYNNVPYQVSNNTNIMTIALDAGQYRFVKSATANAVGLNMSSQEIINGFTAV